jgi:hypothetical protein
MGAGEGVIQSDMKGRLCVINDSYFNDNGVYAVMARYLWATVTAQQNGKNKMLLNALKWACWTKPL